MLIGEYAHTIDSKGRVILPSKFRAVFGEKIILTKSFDECIYGYSLSEWHNIEEKINTLPVVTNKEARNFVRFFFSNALECDIDSQGRILVSQSLREFASLKKELIIIGVSSRIEIWNKEKWEEYINSQNTKEIAEKMSFLGI